MKKYRFSLLWVLFVVLVLGCPLLSIISSHQVATPIFTPGAGTYSSDQSVKITCATLGSTINYTLDSTTPNGSSTLYGDPILLAGDGTSKTIRAIATKNGMEDSEVASGGYIINNKKVATPIFSPPAGTYSNAQTVIVSTTTAGASIRYTTDGSTPTSTEGMLYSGPINTVLSMTIRAIAYIAAKTDSDVAIASFTLQVAKPTFNPSAGIYSSDQTVTISTITTEASIRFTIDGSTPTSTVGTLYSEPISVKMCMTIKAIGYNSGWTDSTVAYAAYSLNSWQSSYRIFSEPSGIYCDPGGGNIMVTDQPWQVVFMRGITDMMPSKTDSFCRSWEQIGWPWAYCVDTDYYYNPCGIAMGAYVVDSGNNRIVYLSQDGASSFGKTGSGTNEFQWPKGIAVDTNGHIFIVDSGNGRIVHISNWWGGEWAALGTSGTGTHHFFNPFGVAVDASGHIYVTDSGNNRIVRMDDMSGNGWTTFGSAGSDTHQFNNPCGVAVDDSGHIYISDSNNDRIVRMNDMIGTCWTSFGNQVGSTCQISCPVGIAVDASGYIYVVNSGNHEIIRFIMP